MPRAAAADNNSFERAVIDAVRNLRRGEVASYGEIAQDAGFSGAARAVGNVLSAGADVPWWRVVRADGRLVSPSAEKQARLLRAEGVRIIDGKVEHRRTQRR